jgi:hypothetical protein
VRSQTSHAVRLYIAGEDWTREHPYSLVSVASGRLLGKPVTRPDVRSFITRRELVDGAITTPTLASELNCILDGG